MSNYPYLCGIDLGKNHFSLHAVNKNGKVIPNKSATRSKLLTKKQICQSCVYALKRVRCTLLCKNIQ